MDRSSAAVNRINPSALVAYVFRLYHVMHLLHLHYRLAYSDFAESWNVKRSRDRRALIVACRK